MSLIVLAACPGSAEPNIDAGPTPSIDAGTEPVIDAGTCGENITVAGISVRLSSGVVGGTVDGDVRIYKGVPFAKPPVGDLRWRLPEPLTCFEGGYAAGTDFGPVCPQYQPDGGITGDENCLTLQIWAPRAATLTTPKPVMVFIHGGAHEVGSSSGSIIDGTALAAAGGNIIVSGEYRLGPFGFMAHPALSAEGGEKKSGDYGMHDQIAELKWVKENIAHFGGDPNNVMIFGESAGGESVCRLIASPLAAGLFTSAIIESGPCTAHTLEAAETFGLEIASRAGCGDAGLSTECLRSKSTEALMRSFTPITNLSSDVLSLGFDGVVDGYAVPAIPRAQIATGNFNMVPTIVVSNANELSRGVPDISTELHYRAALTTFFGARATPAMIDKIVAQYTVAGYGTYKAAYVAVISEVTIICAGRRDALTMAARSTAPIRRAIFGDVLANAPAAIKDLGAFHGAELLWLFGGLSKPPYSLLAGPSNQKTVVDMQSAWSTFAATHTPSGGTLPTWPSYAMGSENVMRFEAGSSVTADPFTANCTFWESLQ